MLAAYCSIPRLILGKVIVVRVVSTSVSRSNDVKHILIGFQQALSPQDICILVATLYKHLESALHDTDVLLLKCLMPSGFAYHLLASLLQPPLLNHSLLMSYLLSLCNMLF